MQKQMSTLMQREMTRKEFLATVGFGVATVMGMGSILKFVKPSFGSQIKVSNGYGSRNYGN